ncbi:fatty acid alpha-hydroxylase [Blastocladiella emersonii ATCC 22665]|nr:fatty acid alpha-hydroxylase [Blastocladiella emersonii ATCC 22665]
MAAKRTRSTFTAAEVAKHASENDCWITRRGRVYDVTPFLHDHPGGPDLISEYAGRDLDALMRDGDVHEHSEVAYDILEDYLIGHLEDSGDNASDSGADVGDMDDALPSTTSTTTTVHGAVRAARAAQTLAGIVDPVSALDDQLTEELASAKQPLLDLSKPLLWQMLTANFSKDYYMTQVHIPRHLPEPATIFANPVLELLTRTPWYLVPLCWLPVVAYLAYDATATGGMSLPVLGAHFAAGLVMWTFFEYTFHRFLFHADALLPDHPLALTVHFLMHGIHHYLPMDRMRLVLPPVFFALIVQPPWWAFRAVLDYATCAALFSGGIAGYVVYDLTHYYLHHARVRTPHLREMKKYHLAHHYKNYDSAYGITSKLWDYAFATVLDYAAPAPGAKAKPKAA